MCALKILKNTIVLFYCAADQHTCLLYTDKSNFLNPKFQASKFCDCVEGILSEKGFSRAAAHMKVFSHNYMYLQRFSHRTQ